MLPSSPRVARGPRRPGVALLVLALVVALCPAVEAQYFANRGAVGGIDIDPEGVVSNATTDNLGKLSQLRKENLQQIPGNLRQMAESRKVSLRRLEEAIQRCGGSAERLPQEIKHLAGLQQIRYVFVYPEIKDIVLVGPGEGWQVDGRGNEVGITTGRPVMLLDDLLVALRTARRAANGGISCSIDPNRQRLAQLQKLQRGSNPYQLAARVQEVLGPQEITVSGVPLTSHFARVLVAADYRMKRLGMGLEPSPVPGMPSYLSMMKGNRQGGNLLGPRWWLEPNYEPLLRSPDGLAWELRGASVKALSEQDFLTSGGDLQRSGKADPAARKWADNMSEKYQQLAVAEPVFGQLRNCMELAIVAALVVKEDLTGKAGYSMPLLMDPADLKTEEFLVPKQVVTQTSVQKQGRKWIISASGGVQVNSWSIADRVQQSDAPAPVRAEAVPGENPHWWWN
jgi:hypothetical protein